MTPLQIDPGGIAIRAVEAFVDDLAAALPRLISGIVFLALAIALVKVIMWIVRWVLQRTSPGAAPVYRQFVAAIVAAFLWFGVALTFLSIVGLGAIAAALGTASGFLALGIAYALSGMIEDAVAGVYLLRDPDFAPGDRVTVDDVTGTVRTIELRKTRFEVDGDTVIRANADIEDGWTKLPEE